MADDDVLRKNRGLGMLLASMGNRNMDDTSKTVIPQVTNVEYEDDGFDPESSGFSGWDDISSSRNTDRAAGDSEMSTQQSNNERNEEASGGMQDNHPSGVQKPNPEGKNKRKNQDESMFGSGNTSSWASMKEYDDDHDSQWFEDENARLAELYGGNFIYAKYLDSQPGKVGYYCELCFAEMNARKSLELHCSGMKHLKKKAMWEKMDGHDEDSSDRPERGPSQPPHKILRQSQRPRPPPRHPPPYDWHNRGPPPVDFRGPRPLMEYQPHREPPPPEFRDNRGHYDRRDDYDRYADDYYDDYYRKESMPYRPPFDEDPLYGRRGSPGPRDLSRPPGPDRRDMRDQYSRERYEPYDRREAPPAPVISGPEGPGTGRMPPYPPLLGSPVALFEGISDGSCSELLKRLAVCRVKSMEDSALATNVTTFLVMSLKEYYSRVGPPSVAHVLEEINVKINIMKDLLKVNPPQ